MLKKISLALALLAMMFIASPLMTQPVAADDSPRVTEDQSKRPRPAQTPGPRGGNEED